jgi:membrane associated rhomboid family serine protease
MLPTNSLIPIHDDNPTRTFSYLTASLIALNVLIFAVQYVVSQSEPSGGLAFFYEWGLVPWELTHSQPVSQEVLQAGGLDVSCSPPACFPQKSVYLSLISSMFLHGGLAHLGGNMLFLWVFGNNIEDNLGKVRFLLFYFTAGILASLAHVAANTESVIPTVGASGAIAGLLGAYILLFPHARITTLVFILFFVQFLHIPAVMWLGLWFLSQFLIGAGQQIGEPGVAWLAHVGGFVAGAALIYLFGGRRPRARPAFPGYEP